MMQDYEMRQKAKLDNSEAKRKFREELDKQQREFSEKKQAFLRDRKEFAKMCEDLDEKKLMTELERKHLKEKKIEELQKQR